MSSTNAATAWADSAARILRPRRLDGNDAGDVSRPVPDPTTGQITYDVDNDGDGITDSVWLDLGYPARPDSSGRLYKPLFAFMVIGLNGRIPLNTAGNLAGIGGGAIGTSTLGDATPDGWRSAPRRCTWATRSARSTRPYALQNGFDRESTERSDWPPSPLPRSASSTRWTAPRPS